MLSSLFYKRLSISFLAKTAKIGIKSLAKILFLHTLQAYEFAFSPNSHTFRICANKLLQKTLQKEEGVTSQILTKERKKEYQQSILLFLETWQILSLFSCRYQECKD